MEPLFQHLDYRAFLQAFYESRKEETRFFSYRFMAQRLDIDPGQLVKILQGKLHLPERALPAVAKLCGFSAREAAYFEELVKFSKARTREETARSFERLMSLKGVEARSLTDEQTEYYLGWRHTVVRSLIGLAPFRGDFAALGAQCIPPISADEARASVELLEKLGLVVQDERGTWRLSDVHLTPGPQVPVQAVRQFQSDTIALAERALREMPREDRDISTITVALAREDLETVRGWISDLRRQIQSLTQSTPEPEGVYHLNVQLFPVGRRRVRKAGNA